MHLPGKNHAFCRAASEASTPIPLKWRAISASGKYCMAALKDRITEEMKNAMRAGEKERLATIRLILSAIKQREVDERIQLDDSQVLAAIEKMIKQRKEAMTQFEAGGRADLVAKEGAEIVILQAYLPAQLSDVEV